MNFEKYQIALSIFITVSLLYMYSLYRRYQDYKSPKIVTVDGKELPSRYPPWISHCPDYWYEGPVKGTCKYGKRNGNPKCNSSAIKEDGSLNYDISKKDDVVDLRNMTWVDKCRWTKKCGISWEGVNDKACVPDSFENYHT